MTEQRTTGATDAQIEAAALRRCDDRGTRPDGTLAVPGRCEGSRPCPYCMDETTEDAEYLVPPDARIVERWPEVVQAIDNVLVIGVFDDLCDADIALLREVIGDA